MTRLLLVSPSARPGGAERAFAGIARRLPELGYRPLAVLLEDGPLREWLEAGGCEVELLPAARTRRVHRAALTVARLARLARASGAAAVASNMSKGHVYGGSAARLAGLPALWWQRDVARGTVFERLAARVPAAAVVCASRGAAEAQRRLTPRLRIATIPSGVPVDEVAARKGAGAEARRACGWNGHPAVGIVGRLQPWKGQETFLHAAAALGRSRPDLRFAVVGGAVLGWEGSYPADLARLADELALGERVVFTGHRDDPWDWLDALDVVVHASADEPFGRVLVEALALGKPLVATRGPGPAEIVEDGVSGLLVPPREPAPLAAAVARILDEPGLAGRLAQAGPERAARFSERRAAELLGPLLDDVTGRRRA